MDSQCQEPPLEEGVVSGIHLSHQPLQSPDHNEFCFPAPVTCNQDAIQKHAPSSHSLSGLPFATLNRSQSSYTPLCVYLPDWTIPSFHYSLAKCPVPGPRFPSFRQRQPTFSIQLSSLNGFLIPYSHLTFAPNDLHSYMSINTWLSTYLLFSYLCPYWIKVLIYLS